MIIKTIALLFMAILLSLNTYAANWQNDTYTVTKVTDGDTAILTDGNVTFVLRIAGIDAPEYKQPYGKVSLYKLKELVLKKKVQVKTVGKGYDRYKRVLGQLYLNGKDVGIMMIEAGLATYYRPKCTDYPNASDKYNYDPRLYVAAEKKARSQKLAFFSGVNELPCRFRKR